MVEQLPLSVPKNYLYHLISESFIKVIFLNLKTKNMKLIKNDLYLLLIDEEAEIKKGDYILEKELIINIFPDYLTDLDECSKIIAYYPLTKEAKELDLPELPPFEKDTIGKLAYEKYPVSPQKRKIFIEGYKAAQSKQFSLEDIIAFGKKCFYKGFDKSENDDANSFTAWREECSKLIQSLSTQRLPVNFEPEYETVYFHGSGYYKESQLSVEQRETYSFMKEKRLKTITNSEGREELVGTYKY